MALPVLGLALILLPVVKAFARIMTGAVIAGIVYYILKNTIQPFIDNLSTQAINTVNSFSTVGGSVLELIHYLNFTNCIILIITALAICLNLKITAVALRAFGINVG